MDSTTATIRSRRRPFRPPKSWSRSIRSCSRNGRCVRIPAAPASIAAGSARSMRSRRWPRAATDVSLLGERGKFPPFGVNGGKSAALNRFIYQTADGERSPPLVRKVTDVSIGRGQRVRLETPGGGGYGDPLTRDPRARCPRRHARLHDAGRPARSDYGVVLGEDGAVDAAATGRLAKREPADEAVQHSRRRCRRHFHRFVAVRCADARRSAPPKCRRSAATKRLASCRALPRSAPVASIGSIVHGTTVGTNTLLERRGHKVGVITTRGFRDVLEMRRRDRRRTWGLWGDFTPIVDRDMRMEVDERTLADGTIRTRSMKRRCGRPRSRCASAAPRRSRSFSSTPMPIPRTNSGALAAAQSGLAQRIRLCLAPGAAGNPRVRALLDHGAQQPICSRWSAAISASSSRRSAAQHVQRAVPHRAVERRRDVDGDRAAASGPHRAVGSRGRRDRCRGDRARRRATTTSSPATSAALRSTSR